MYKGDIRIKVGSEGAKNARKEEEGVDGQPKDQ